MSKQRTLVIDGISAIDGLFAGDGELPPFVVFDVDAQENIAGPFQTREAAETHKLAILAGGEPRLDVQVLKECLDKLDNRPESSSHE